ncbi:MAG: hypothetical protein IKZ87_07000 [Actinomycetaceae bacterium]|nr:hypothetical protein [Actinomycetaceae bacterium]
MARMDSSAPQYTNPVAFSRLKNVDQTVDWSRDAIREAREENITISADFTTMVITNTLFVRTTTPQSTLHIGSYWEDDSSIYGPYDIEGAYTHQEFFVDNSSMFLRLNLPDEAAVHRVSYKYRVTSTTPLPQSSVTTLMSWPLRLYTCNLTFEGDVPEKITWTVTHQNEGGSKKNVVTQELHPVGKTASISYNDVPRGESVLTWQ